MQKNNTFEITRTAVFAALIFIATQFIKVPLPFGYANMGDCLVILSGWMIGGSYGCIAAVVGSILADVLSGYAIYVPATLIIKAIMSFAAYKGVQFARKFSGRKKHMALLISAVMVELVMVMGYFIYDVILYEIGGAMISLMGNILQGLIAVVTSYIFFFQKMIDK